MENLVNEQINLILQGKINSDEASENLFGLIELTYDILDSLKDAETLYLKNKNGIQVGNIVTINGQTGNYRGIANGFVCLVVNGNQISIKL